MSPDDMLPEVTPPASPWDYPIDASMTACEALAVILDALLRVMTDAERGVVDARDAESLHDYRVAIRRTRSALSLFGKLLAPGARRDGRKFFKSLGRCTTAARDLDVFVLALPGYLEDWPPAERAGVAGLERRIMRQLEREYDAVCRRLEGEAYRGEVRSWRAHLGRLAASTGGGLFEARAAAAIRDAYDRTDELSGTLQSEAPGDALHRLRIRFKKLRYALEFARPLTPGGEVDAVILLLKELQDQLGEHQDLLVHGQLIAKFGTAAESGEQASAAVRRLGEALAEGRLGLRSAIEANAPELEAQLASELDHALAHLGEMR